MRLMTYNEILTGLCDIFDSLISPRTMLRSNTNIFYLILKAISKGYEVINNICVALSHKFDPANCAEEDLISVADLVGTEKLAGSSSGLEIIISNPTENAVILPADFYTYALDDDTSFIFEILEATTLEAGETLSVIAMSENVGVYEVTAQESITVTRRNGDVPSELKFSCEDNVNLLGEPAETDLAFRERVMTDTTRQDTIKELEMKLRNLPYLFDARIVFNNTIANMQVGSYTLPPFVMLIFFNGAPRNQIAEVVASSGIYPTLETADAVTVKYASEVFASGSYDVFITPFAQTHYKIKVNYQLDHTYNTTDKVEAEIKSFLLKRFRGHVHYDYIKETDVYEALSSLTMAGVNILNVDFAQSGVDVPFVEVPITDIPYLDDVLFAEV